jgi:signal peptidase I
MAESNKAIKAALSWAWQIALVILATLVISVLIIQTYDIEDISMEPTFDRQGNRVLVFLTPHLFQALPDYGDIVIIDSRTDHTRNLLDRFIESPLPNLFAGEKKEYMLVKRVIGLPGDTLESQGGFMYRNEEKLEEPYIKEKMAESIEPVLVPEGHIYVMGDNRNRSKDSRHIGPVPLSNVQGRVVLRIFPLNMITTF